MSKLILIILLFNFVSCNKTEEQTSSKANYQHKKNEFYYTCSMHPQIKEKKPGKCPICHMNLTKVEVDNDEDTNLSSNPKVAKNWVCKDFPNIKKEKPGTCPIDGTPLVKVSGEKKAAKIIGKVKLRKAQLSHFRPSYFPVTTMKMSKKVRLLGSVVQSEEKESNIPARIGGRVEKVFIRSAGAYVKKGDPVLQLYSPKLITAGEEYLVAKKSYLKSKSGDQLDLLKQSEQRLKLWGIRNFQYEKWFRKSKVPRKITIYSENTGIVRKRNAIVGKYFKEGQNFFELSNLSDVWVEMDVYEHDSSLIDMNQSVSMKFTALPGKTITGSIDFINPVLDPKSRTLKVRATIPNEQGLLRPGMVADATVNINLPGTPLVIPRSAIIDTGKRQVAWIKVNKKSFRAKVIETGLESEGYVQVVHGLMEGEEVVLDGNFLLDAQAQLFGGYEDIKESTNSNHSHH